MWYWRGLLLAVACTVFTLLAVMIAGGAGNTVTVVDLAANPNTSNEPFTSIRTGADGLPVIAYVGTPPALKVAHCGNVTCTAGNTISPIDSDGGLSASMAIGTDGFPVISYYDDTNADLKVAHCGDAACTTGNTLTTIDSAGQVGFYTSVAVGTDGLPVISYRDVSTFDLKVAHCGNAACTSGTAITTVDSVGDVGKFSSVAVGTDGLPIISYLDTTDLFNNTLEVLHCGTAACSAGNSSTTIGGAAGFGDDAFTSIAIGADGLPVISFVGVEGLSVAHCGNAACSAANAVTTVDAAGGEYSSLTVGSDGLPLISYRSYEHELRTAHCGNAACTSGNTIGVVDGPAVVDGVPTADPGFDTSVTVGADGLPVISYLARSSLTTNLKVAHCGDAVCKPPPPTPTPTPSPTTTPAPPPPDSDGDGCTDGRESSSNPVTGGRRDPLSFWDFFDVPVGSPLARDRAVSAGDIAGVVARFGSNDATAGDFDRASDPLSTPNGVVQPAGARQNYHPAYDRGGAIPGQELWDLLPPDGSITAGDIAGVVTQFGHSCT